MNKTIIGIKFKKPGKIYFFDPKNEKFKKGDFVIVDTANGMEFAEVIVENKEIGQLGNGYTEKAFIYEKKL